MEYVFGGNVNDRSAVVRSEDNVVINVIVAPPTEPAQDGCYLVDVSDGKFCDIGWVWNGTSFYDPDPKPAPNNEPEDYVDFIDTVYVDGEIIRQDYSIRLPEAAALIETLKENFPDTTINFQSFPSNLIGSYDGYRPPYTNESISFYEMCTPSTELLQEYGISSTEYPDIFSWYGLKHNLITKDIILKLVFSGNAIPPTRLPIDLPVSQIGNSFFARTHYKDGTVEPYIDYYLNTTEDEIVKFCSNNNIPFTPVICEEGEFLLYGITFDYDTKEILNVKTYMRKVV